MNSEKNLLLFAFFAIASLGVVLFAFFAMWWGLNLSVQPQTVANVLAPLVLTAAFIERAVEVIISPWRGPKADRLKALSTGKSKLTATEEEQRTAPDELKKHKDETTVYAFAAAVMFGLVAAMVGVRALWPFLGEQAMTTFKSASAGQQGTFIVFDVVISAALMAGGANGFHSVMNAFTSFFDASAQKSQNSANS
jgi:hypothetical protein